MRDPIARSCMLFRSAASAVALAITAATTAIAQSPPTGVTVPTATAAAAGRAGILGRPLTVSGPEHVRLGLAAALRTPSAAQARANFLVALAAARRRLLLPMKAPTFDVRVAAYRDAVEVLFSAYASLRRDPALLPERASIDKALQDALATLPADDAMRPLLEGLWAAGASARNLRRMREAEESTTMRRNDVVAQVTEGIVVSVVAVVVSGSSFGGGRSLSVAQVTGPVAGETMFDPSSIRGWSRERDASLTRAIEAARRPAEAGRADARVQSAAAALRRLIVDLETSLARAS